MRLDKFLSECKVLSRKDCAVAAKCGRISVNGSPVKKSDTQVSPDMDEITLDGAVISYRPFIYIMLNKPEGYVSATEDSSLPCVVELLSDELLRFNPFPCGRLDRDTVGLMILTNDGALAHALTSPKHHAPKLYRFRCSEPIESDAIPLFEQGVTLADGYVCKSAKLALDPDRRGGTIELTEGKYHQIKRMIASLDNRVTYLERISFGEIALDDTLERGEFRHLTDTELSTLRKYAK